MGAGANASCFGASGRYGKRLQRNYRHCYACCGNGTVCCLRRFDLPEKHVESPRGYRPCLRDIATNGGDGVDEPAAYADFYGDPGDGGYPHAAACDYPLQSDEGGN